MSEKTYPIDIEKRPPHAYVTWRELSPIVDKLNNTSNTVAKELGKTSTSIAYYVDPTYGDDSHDGRSSATALATPAAAFLKIGNYLSENAYIYLLAGTHTINTAAFTDMNFAAGAKLTIEGDKTAVQSGYAITAGGANTIQLTAAAFGVNAYRGYFFAYSTAPTTYYPILSNTADTLTVPTLATGNWSAVGTITIYQPTTLITATASTTVTGSTTNYDVNGIVFKMLSCSKAVNITSTRGAIKVESCAFSGAVVNTFSDVYCQRNYVAAGTTLNATYFTETGVQNLNGINGTSSLIEVTLTPTEEYASGTTYYVRSTGSDSNDGLTVATAFLTLTKAISMIPNKTSEDFTVGTHTIEPTVTYVINAKEAATFELSAASTVIANKKPFRIEGLTAVPTLGAGEVATAAAAELGGATVRSLTYTPATATPWATNELIGMFMYYTGSTTLIPIIDCTNAGATTTLFLPPQAGAYSVATDINIVELVTTLDTTAIAAIDVIGTTDVEGTAEYVFKNVIFDANLTLRGFWFEECTYVGAANTTFPYGFFRRCYMDNTGGGTPHMIAKTAETCVVKNGRVEADLLSYCYLQTCGLGRYAHPFMPMLSEKIYHGSDLIQTTVTNVPTAPALSPISDILVSLCYRNALAAGTRVDWYILNGTLRVNGLVNGDAAGGIVGHKAVLDLRAVSMEGILTLIPGITGAGADANYVVAGYHGTSIIYDSANTAVGHPGGADLAWHLGGTPTQAASWAAGDAYDAAEIDNRAYDITKL